jgi:hypothetical protein
MSKSLHDPRQMSQDDLTALGISDVVYVKPVMSDDVKAADLEGVEGIPDGILLYSVHTADGTPVALLDDRDTAFAAARQYSMEPLSVH